MGLCHDLVSERLPKLCHLSNTPLPHTFYPAVSTSIKRKHQTSQLPAAGPQILSAPLLTVLDRLDVLEDLVILLDPESHGVKSTKHLASLCSFSSSWITYTYSMKDSKSPLKAVLEGITSRHPDWTVGHLAKMFRDMERHDAIAVLGNLDINKLDV